MSVHMLLCLEGPGKEHNCSDQSTMLHALLHERAMNLDEIWDKYEALFCTASKFKQTQEYT